MGFDNLLQTLATLITCRGVTGTTAAIVGLIAVLVFLGILLQKSGRRLPPGPYPLPIIGNLHQLRLPAHRCLKDLSAKYGPIMFLRFGSVPTVVVSSPEIAKEFLKTHDLIFASRPLTAAGKYFFYNFRDIALCPYGDHWRQMRRICVVELLTARRIESFKNLREEVVSAAMRSIWEKSEKGTIPVNVTKAISSLISNIIWQILASHKFSDDDLGANDKGFKDLILEVSAAVGEFNIGDFIPYFDWLDLQGIKRRLKKANKRFDAFAEKLIEDHQLLHHRVAAEETEAEPLKDFVDVLLEIAETYKNTHTKITRETIKALIFDMFAGGMETTTTAIEWAMSELLRHPPAMKRLQGEIESVVGERRKVKESDLAAMKYLHCVVKETFRLYPPLPLSLPHQSTEAVTVRGYYIPKKTMLLVNMWAIGRDPTVWGADASEFKPERFMGEEYIDLTGQSDNFKIFPFGSGRRGCPGSPMAIPIVELLLSHLVHVFDWRVEGDASELDMKESSAATMPREVPLFAFPRLRNPDYLYYP